MHFLEWFSFLKWNDYKITMAQINVFYPLQREQNFFFNFAVVLTQFKMPQKKVTYFPWKNHCF